MNARRFDASEDGTVVVLALAFMVVWALVVYALLNLAATGFEVIAGADERTDRIYAGEGAVDLAIAALVDDPNPEDGTCPSFTVELAGQSVRLDCDLAQGPNVRVADLTARISEQPQLRARIRIDDEAGTPQVAILNWTVLR